MEESRLHILSCLCPRNGRSVPTNYSAWSLLREESDTLCTSYLPI